MPGKQHALRRKDDHYVTPDWTVKRLLEKYNPPPGVWLDPCAANCELLSVCHSLRPNNLYHAMEKRITDTSLLGFLKSRLVGVDFLSPEVPVKTFNFIITNPPYKFAFQFLEQSLLWTDVVAFLLRLSFMNGGQRAHINESLNPGLFFLPNRPGFTGFGSDFSEYAWFVYGDPTVAGRHFTLASTSDAEIDAWNEKAKLIHSASVLSEI